MLQNYSWTFTKKNGTKKYDEYVINNVFYDKISFLPLIYGIPDFGFTNPSTNNPAIFLYKFKNYTNYTVEDMEYASKNRVISHGCYEMVKWWEKKYDNLTKIISNGYFMLQKVMSLMKYAKNINNFNLNVSK